MQTYTLPLLAALFGTILLFLGISSFLEHKNTASEIETEKPGNTASENKNTVPYGLVTIRVGELAVFEDITIMPLQIIEESRCVQNVVCIQAGTVRVLVQIVSGMGTSTDPIALGNSITTEAEKVEFTAATPYPVTSERIPASAYELTFNVTKRPAEAFSPQEEN